MRHPGHLRTFQPRWAGFARRRQRGALEYPTGFEALVYLRAMCQVGGGDGGARFSGEGIVMACETAAALADSPGLGHRASPAAAGYARDQFSVGRPSTHLKCRSLLVTRIALMALAWAAMSRSMAPIGIPATSRVARTVP